jgi:predicted O-methyltransferase YrrM
VYKRIRDKLITARIKASLLTVRILNRFGFNVASISDYYSVLPVAAVLKQNQNRWFKPSDLKGIKYDLDAMKQLLSELTSLYADEYNGLPSYAENKSKGYGPGYTAVDARVLYYMLRELKPDRYIEVGSGLSTFYCSLANQRNSVSGTPIQITCIEPYPYPALQTVNGIQVLDKEVQDIELSVFEQLEANDVLFIDSSHVIRIDGDVPYLFLEVLPRLKKGVVVHVHDIPFPYNVPYPPQLWIFGQQWPSFWNEAMLLQAFLCYNDAYEVLLSAPLIRHTDEGFLAGIIPEYETLEQNLNTFSSIWIRKTR